MRKRSLIASGVALVLGAVLAASVGLRGSGSDGTVTAATLDQAVDGVLSQLGPGKALRIVTASYARQGPSAAEVAASEWPAPERWTTERWVVFGEDGQSTTSRVISRDASGRVWQETARVGDQRVSRNFYTGNTLSFPWRPYSVETQVAIVKARNLAPVLEGQGTLTEGLLDGQRSAVLERQYPITPDMYPAKDGFAVPDLSDLNGETLVSRTEVAVENPLFVRWSLYAVDRDGQRHLVERRETVAVEVVDLADVPEHVLTTPSWAS